MDNSNQITREGLTDIRDELNTLINYFNELKDLISENLTIDGKIYNEESFSNIYDSIVAMVDEVETLIYSLQ